MDDIIIGRLSASVIRYISEVLAEPHDGSYKGAEPVAEHVAARAAAEGVVDPPPVDVPLTPTAIDALMETLTGDVVGYISYRLNRLNTTVEHETPRIVDVDVIHKLARDVVVRTGIDVAQSDKGRQFSDKCIEAYVFVGEIEAWLKRNVTAKNREVLTSIANLKAILQAA